MPSCRVLVVEDNLDTVHTLVALLKADGHQVEFAINGYAAMSVAARFLPEVVILDLGLPGLNGFEGCERLKREPQFKGTRFIAVSGYFKDEDRVRSRAAGCDLHLAKPADPVHLLSLVSAEETAPSSAGREHRVLVVDDNLDAAHSFAVMVEKFGHKTQFAVNGYVAINLAQKFQPDYVFLDLMMPGIDGFEVARRLKKEFGDDIHIIAVTALGSEQDRDKAAKAGCEKHLMKPVEARVIEDLLV